MIAQFLRRRLLRELGHSWLGFHREVEVSDVVFMPSASTGARHALSSCAVPGGDSSSSIRNACRHGSIGKRASSTRWKAITALCSVLAAKVFGQGKVCGLG